VSGHALLMIREEKLTENPGNLYISVQNKFIPQYETRNIAGFVEGSRAADSFLVFTAHYDHLGKMGKDVYFPGANDNASGTAMLLDLARHYSLPENRPAYSILFIACAAEEANLAGSTYFAEHPLIPLDNIRFLVNLDMVGTGSEGITVVNATVFEKEYNLLKEINETGKYLSEVASRGESCNSDHCPFYQKGVPAVFIYTRGREFLEYHNVKDRAVDLPMTAYNGLFRLLTNFLNQLQN
jgi:Zn-dependent M28 family amino/carboxypeptidase